MEQSHKTINGRFTTIADKVSEGLGAWWFTVVSLIVLFLWTLYGLVILSHSIGEWFTSSQWNFPLNTITTVGEWFIGALVAAATNRVERRHDVLLETIKARTTSDVETTRKNEQDIQEIAQDLQTIKRLLAKVVTEEQVR